VYIVTFYSYRGGVGRTTALVNVGLELARRGRNVLLVDFDLESPDLTSFPMLGQEERHPGIVDYVEVYRETGRSPEITEYLYPVELSGTKGGQLWVMPAGRGDAKYWEALAEIDWQVLYDHQGGYLFFEDTRLQWEKLGVNYVLIDTHSGITPPLGISTRQLADAVVMVFNPHKSGNDGLNEVSWRIDQESEQRIDKESEQTGRKPIEQFFVASSVVEADESLSSLLNNGEYETEAGIFPLAALVPFSYRLLFGKQLLVGEDRTGRLAQEYRRLAHALIRVNFTQDRDGALLMLRKMLSDPSTVIGRGRV
jgi:cellulose biosynthesis protein BcsQ